jgi:threonine dehydratase
MHPTLATLEAAAATVHAVMPPTPQYSWPLLNARAGTEVWVKHENHTPLGAFKVRGGLTYFEQLRRTQPHVQRVVCATRGNHGQSVAYAAARQGLAATIVVPHGNSSEKNAAMRALGARLIEAGDDFQAAREHAAMLAQRDGLHAIPSFHPDLVSGVASYCLEFLRGAPSLDVVFVPIGLGSGICAMIAARDALGLKTEIVGVVSAHAPAYARSLAAGKILPHAVSTVLADGMACSTPDPAAFDIIRTGVSHIVEVTDDEIAEAMRALYQDTHNVAEGSGAAGFAALMQTRAAHAGRRAGVVMSGGNVDRALLQRVLGGSALEPTAPAAPTDTAHRQANACVLR